MKLIISCYAVASLAAIVVTDAFQGALCTFPHRLLIPATNKGTQWHPTHVRSTPFAFDTRQSSSPLFSMVSTYEKLQERLPSESVVKAVANLPTNKVIASDVAAKAGVSLSQARKDLTALASLSRGDISVTQDGELVYEFPSNLRSVMLQNSAKYKVVQTFRQIWPNIFWGIRVAFGVTLLASLVLIFSTLLLAQAAVVQGDDKEDSSGFHGTRSRGRSMRYRGGFSFGGPFDPVFGPGPFDFFYYRPYHYYGHYGGPQRQYNREPQAQVARDPNEMGFLDSVFSYVFGDGNPNHDMEEKRLQLVANMIRSHNGAVTAEQLAPFCDAPFPDSSFSTYVDEAFVLPIVSQLGGEPQVTPDGDIIYIFPELQVSTSRIPVGNDTRGHTTNKRQDFTTSDLFAELSEPFMNLIQGRVVVNTKQGKRDTNDDQSIFQEIEHKFSLAPKNYLFLAGGLGVLNLLGTVALRDFMLHLGSAGVQLPSVFGLTQTIYPFLSMFALVYNVVPIARNLWINSENAQIVQRNKARRRWRAFLQSGRGHIQRKLRAAAAYAQEMTILRDKDVVYSTKKKASDIKLEQHQLELDDFDHLLEGR